MKLPLPKKRYRRTHEGSLLAMHMSEEPEVAAYFDLDGTLLNDSSEKTLTGVLSKRRPRRIPNATIAWALRTELAL